MNYEHGRELEINKGNTSYCQGATGNPFYYLRLGQSQYEIKNYKRAAEELIRDCTLTGMELLKDEDLKYFEFLKTQISIN